MLPVAAEGGCHAVLHPMNLATQLIAAAVLQAQPAPTVQGAIPPTFHGSWRETAAECGRHTESRLEVGPNRLRFYESDQEVQSVRVRSARAIDVTTIAEGEGQVWEDTLTILLSSDGNRLAIQHPDGPYTRVRCPAASR